jgi:hypothetical protein
MILQLLYGLVMAKKRYTKNKICFTSKESTIFPYDKYRVEWLDCISDSGWADKKEFINMKLATPVNEGWLFSKDKNYVKLFAAYIPEEDGTYTYGDRTNIPTSWVVKMTKI